MISFEQAGSLKIPPDLLLINPVETHQELNIVAPGQADERAPSPSRATR